MSKQIAFSKSLPLPAMVTREAAIIMLHDHGDMAKLNPQVINHRSIQIPRGVVANEKSGYEWYELSEDISHLSMGTARAVASYKICYRNLSNGVDFHVYGPQGLDVKEQWTIIDPPELDETSSVAARKCIWLRRDCNVNSISIMSPLTEKNIYRAHQVFEERIIDRCLPDRHPSRPKFPFSRSSSLAFSRLSSRSSMDSTRVIARKRTSMVSMLDPADTHPAFRDAVNWSLVSDTTCVTPSPRTSSLTSRSSRSPVSPLKRLSNQYSAHRQSSEISSRSSYAESALSSLPSKRRDSASTYNSNSTSLPPSPVQTTFEGKIEPKPLPDEYNEMGGNPYTAEPSITQSIASTSGSSTPSLTEESSDDEVTTPLDEIPSPLDSTSAAQIFEAMQKHHFSTRSTSPCPPPIPERAESRSIPQPLSIRPPSVLSCYEGGITFPFDRLPQRTSSMKRCSNRRRPVKILNQADAQENICTDETERMLDLATGNRFSTYG